MDAKLCPCGSQKNYRECCGKYHLGKVPEHALSLMRSRYSAYAEGNCGYIVDTTNPAQLNAIENLEDWKLGISHFCKENEFVKLEVKEFIEGNDISYVTFIAHLKNSQGEYRLKEKSRFDKINDKWLYTSYDWHHVEL